jgi:hypothetical protein
MSYSLNLELSPRRYSQGSVEVWLNWSNRVGESGTEPAMIFTRKQGDRRQLVGLRLSEIHNYMLNSGYGAAGLIHMGMKIAEAIGCAAGDKFAARDVADLIVEYAPDLIKMPGEPPADEKLAAPGPKAELSLQIDGQTVIETEVAV